ncbi:bifunctional precorrin-2 dehydrogenase/sirohydrochlorin ferrochelatase [Candidatus Sulfurimonas marisnigri]|uniref:precorrin-2 dehydrogenase n=1 Tax=Candidatus Sulfurimonas marisnigri TaxID=2740405 RepID=A0A7S7M0H1_9BACT|nr:bifunctional precorrin-2 dehydrogenase/sirohydrochlorin ferrochelatase [Candidatus Sulfurimonas marisnigri]QOY54831.1 bifunctional precorrin-2 dehydrogenase/sirohydrochlorin ferrochelatase [Candidatus Sulfurimonas marisnigri]
MSYFPAFLKLDNKKILIVGGGNIAYEKLERLLDFTSNISVISPKISEIMNKTIKEKTLHVENREYKTGDIKDFAIVIVAVDDISLQEKIFSESKKYKCLCNAVDSVDYCDFIFPSYIKQDDLTIAISTSGASPAMAKQLKSYIKNLLPSGLSDFLAQMKALRKTLPKGRERMKMLEKKAADYMRLHSDG